ncbi:MAG: BsuPI-related putative proteinase inhibitor [Halobacteriales archaeon]|nr:BsuPI-related putative proteinase inhibitor [Halobacteriales archaeon]
MNFEAALEADVEAGRVELTFSVANVGTEPATLQFAGDVAAEIAVRRGGEVVWTWRDERAPGDAGTPLRDQELAPGDTVVHRAIWDAPPPGEYVAEATVAARNLDASARAEFAV